MYLVDKSKNMIYQFYLGSEVVEGFNQNVDNLIWVVMFDNEIVVFWFVQFCCINQKLGKFVIFEMEVFGQFVDVYEVWEMLQFQCRF